MKDSRNLHPNAAWRRALAIGLAFSSMQMIGCATSPRIGSGSPTAPLGLFRKAKGSPWTILCMEIQGTYRKDYIDRFAETLKRTSGIRKERVFVEDDPGGYAKLYYGTYYRRSNSKTGKWTIPDRLRADLKLIHELVGDAGERFFARARIVRVPLTDVGISEWALHKAPGVHSLQVAAFEPRNDFWEYKQAAADYCKWLRKKGYEAYYDHGPACSIVTVGSFDESAFVATRLGMGYYSPGVQALQQDDLLKYNRVNGAIIRSRSVGLADMARFRPARLNQTGGGYGRSAATPVPSRLVRIPRGDNKPSR